jgi:hypothetical protein
VEQDSFLFWEFAHIIAGLLPPRQSYLPCVVTDALVADLRERLPAGYTLTGPTWLDEDETRRVYLYRFSATVSDLAHGNPPETVSLCDPQSLNRLDSLLVRAGVPLRGQT